MAQSVSIPKLARLAYALLLAATAGAIAAAMTPARAIPAFAQQTGQPCTACHVGAFGPVLTPYGRAFEIGGYVTTGGQGWAAHVPASVMLLGSYTNTDQSLPAPASQHFGRNGNFAMDQISLFVGGRATDWLGGMVQTTFSGITSTWKLDNTDIKATKSFEVGETDLRVGMDVNNGPTVQDPYNSTYAWGFPYVASALAPVPTAQPLIAGALAGNSIGATLYAWYDRALYLEGGLYNTYGPWLLTHTGTFYGPGSTANPAPYGRAAYEWDWNNQSAYVGGLFLYSRINPATAPRVSTGSFGKDSYTDLAVDAGYQFLGDGTHTLTAYAIQAWEIQNLVSLTNMGASSQPNNNLNQFRLTLTYFYQQTYGAAIAWQKTWGKANPLLYAPAPVTGSANGKPNSDAIILQADWVPFGKADSWGAPFVNMRFGIQYVIYPQFNGGGDNYDGSGRKASANNTLYLFAWMIF
jgi:hypothetical protein